MGVKDLTIADDFMGFSEFVEQLQRVIDVVHSYCRKWGLNANVSKSAVMTLGKGSVKSSWKWGNRICRGSFVLGRGLQR